MEHISHIIGKMTPEEATWLCDTCGAVLPYYSERSERYFPSMCLCQKAAKAEYEAKQRLHKLVEQRAYTYDWFAESFSVDSDEVNTLATYTFENFEEYRQPQAVYSTQVFAQMLTGTLILYGSYGTGKTHLLAALCQELHLREIGCRFTTAPHLFAAIQWCMAHDMDYSVIIRRAIAAPLLIIDDIDKANWSDFRGERYFEIFNSRVLAHRPTAISTNQLDKLHTYIGSACVSRLSAKVVTEEMVGPDYRREL